MGLFSRSKPAAPAKVVRPIVIQPSDLGEFSARLEATERTAGGPAGPRRAAIRALSESVGGVDVVTLFGLGLDTEEFKRPWRWFAKACELANSLGQYELPPRVFIFAHWWRSLEGQWTPGNYTDMLLHEVPEDAYQAIIAATADAISHLRDDHVIAPAAGEVSPPVGAIRGLVRATSVA